MFSPALLMINFFSFPMCKSSQFETAPYRNVDQRRFEYLSNTKPEDLKMIKEMLPDYKEMSPDEHGEGTEVLNQAINSEFANIVSNLALEHEIYFQAKLDAIKRAMESAFLYATGTIDRSYIDRVLSMIRSEVEEKRRLNQQLEFGKVQINRHPFGG